MLSSNWTALLAFLGVIALIPLTLWALKRSSLASGGHGPMRLLATVPMGPGQRVVTLEVDDGIERRWLVVGITPAGMSVLSTLHPNATVALPDDGPSHAHDAVASSPQTMPPTSADERTERLAPRRPMPRPMAPAFAGRFATLLAQVPRMQRAMQAAARHEH